MKFNKLWLDSFVNNNLSADELSDLITMAGLEVDTVEGVCADFSNVVVAKVLECWNHENSDHLHVTKIDAGDGEIYQVVCGAPNCRQGLKVAFAKVGAVLPGIRIKAAKLRGVESFGMLCSYKELGMAEESNGIIELPEDAPVGTDLHDYMKLNDHTIDVDLTSNRPDCLSVRGIAREVAVLTNTDLNLNDNIKVTPTITDTYNVKVEDTKACPRYLCRVVKGVNQKAQSPLWLTERLRRCGLRSVSPIVDVTNYVMLELGQPLHAFDLNKLQGDICVRFSKDGEKIVLLSGEEATLNNDTLVIADNSGPIGLAGIFGGLNSGISNETTDVVFESAFFSVNAIKGRARKYGLKTDASHRFERGVDSEIQELAIERATELLIEIAGGSAGPINKSEDLENLPKHNEIILRTARLERVLGKRICDDEIFNILQRLGLNPKKIEGGFSAVSPSFRFDLAIEEDLIEEIARIHGYNNIANTIPVTHLMMGNQKEEVLTDRAIRNALVENGYLEAITYSFTDPKVQKAIIKDEAIELVSPISPELSTMRLSMLPGLLIAAKYNLNRQQKRVRLFEIGLTYVPCKEAENGVLQQKKLGGVILGTAEAETWTQKPRNVDFFDIKGDVEKLLSLCADSKAFTFVRTSKDFLHPGQGADILRDGKVVGYVGLLHPSVEKELGFKQNVFVFELDYDMLATRKVPLYEGISKFPSISRDFAFVCDSSMSSFEFLQALSSVAGSLVRDIRIFDVFKDETLEAQNKVSIALSVTLQDNEKTLEDAEVEAISKKIIDVAQEKFGATLRA